VDWIPGYWHFDTERKDFIWVSGFWRRVPPGRTWVPGYWREVEGGHRYVSGYWAAEGQGEVEYLPRPPASVEAGPSTPATSDEHQWVPGHWRWQDGHYVWQPGYWTELQPGWIWNPAYYVETPGGCIYVDGYWDYSLRRRGLLFAPVYFGRNLGAGFVWQPTVCWDSDLIIDHLFVNVGFGGGWGGYWFGDFYGPSWWGLGFRPWFGFGSLTGCFCPFFAYHRCWFQRTNPNWVWQCQNHFQQCWNNAAQRPPATFAAQQRDLARLTGAELARARENAAIKPVRDLGNQLAKDPQAVTQLRGVPPADRQAAAQIAKEKALARQQRADLDRKALATRTTGALTGQPKPIVKLPAPQPPAGTATGATSPPASRPTVGPVKVPPSVTAARPPVPGTRTSVGTVPPKPAPGATPSTGAAVRPGASAPRVPPTARVTPPPAPKPVPPIAASGDNVSRPAPMPRIDVGATRMPTPGATLPPPVRSAPPPTSARSFTPAAPPAPARSFTPAPPSPARSFTPAPSPGPSRSGAPSVAPPSRGFGGAPGGARPSPPPAGRPGARPGGKG